MTINNVTDQHWKLDDKANDQNIEKINLQFFDDKRARHEEETSQKTIENTQGKKAYLYRVTDPNSITKFDHSRKTRVPELPPHD